MYKQCYQLNVNQCDSHVHKMQQISKLTLVLVAVAIYLIWMDVALYINLQQLPPLKERLESKAKPPGTPFSPFEPITIKLLMMCPPMQYIDLPLATWIEDATQISIYVTPNMVSIFGCICGLIAARLFYYESYKLRLLGFVFFRIRDLADNLDGIVARQRAHELKMNIKPGTFGFAMDGICDGIADVTVIIAVGIYLLRNNIQNTDNYKRLKDEESLEVKENPKNLWSKLKNLQLQWFMPIVGKTILFACLFGICSGIWNYFMYHYHLLFDTDLIAQSEFQQEIQLAVLKSPMMWLIIFIWRWINAVTMIEFFIIAILYNKAEVFLDGMKQHGTLIVLATSLLTYIHYSYALDKIANS